MKTIKKIKLKNFKRFETFKVEFDDELNLLIGDNEAGKSSVLTAIDIVLSGSRSKIDTLGIEGLFNLDAIEKFLNSTKKYEELPVLFVELYLSEQNNPDLNGKNNSDERICDGLRLCVEPNDELGKEIKEILAQEESNFPFEYYTISFKTFSGESYTGYRKFLKHIFIDNSQINNEYATREYVKAMYGSNASDGEKHKHHNEYRKSKEAFRANILNNVNQRLIDYAFGIRNNHKANLETDLTLTENNINIENKGKGKQCFIKTEFALNKKSSKIDIILIEEPENHLSHLNMKKLIAKISETEGKQLFITTHNDLISTRLNLKKSILLNSNNLLPILLKDLTEETANFFIKAPDNNIIEFVLSKKVILVEGDAEYILMEVFFKKVTGMELSASDIHIISIGGTSFKRYMELAKLLNIRTAIIRDNDKNHQENCINNYSDYITDFIEVFSDKNDLKYTFEVCLYEDNQEICDELFSKGRRSLSVQEYMLQNKADVTFKILEKKSIEVIVPEYIKSAIEWIKE